MNRYALLFAAAVLSLPGCDSQVSNRLEWDFDGIVHGFASVPNSEVDVRRLVDNALVSRRSVMFIDVDWAITEIYHRRYAEFLVAYHTQHPNDSLMFHFVDCSSVSQDYGPLREIPGWQQLMVDAGTAMIHGNGEIAWIENGRVLHVQSIRAFNTASELVEFTETLMPTSRGH
ncbi:hypothetical protein RISK_005416 [Rhodopirellula islandica]|uniref:Uncharacterized protein n=2 Tax=Rhodopirellula islandica TaxID=595434 RepID=A0A0J1B6A7_RHOIS|nr:hypothetical protein RISK_005416 [Rhodopirellula islandica]